MTRYITAEKFGKKVRGAWGPALVAAFLHKGTAWLGAGTLTWATVVLMGGFASQVPMSDFVQITYLVVAIACLLALALLTTKLVTRKNIYTGSLDPVHLSYSDKRLHVITIIQIISCILQFFLLILPCMYTAMSSIQRPEFKGIHIRPPFPWNHQTDDAGSVSDVQACLQKCESDPSSNSTVMTLGNCVQLCFPATAINNLQVSLFTFFLLVIVTCVLASCSLLYVAVESSFWARKSLSLKKYHDEVLSRALNLGLVEADQFDEREFLLRGLGEDLVIRNIGSLEVKRKNADFVKYLYYHPKGVEMVYEWLASEDTLRQQTVANMVGFWVREERLEKHTALLCRLAEKLGLAGKTAEGSTNSFSALGVAWKDRSRSPLLNINVLCDEVSGGGMCNVVERVVDLVLKRRAPTLQVYIRVLDSVFMCASIRDWLASSQGSKFQEIKVMLLSIIQGDLRNQNRSNGQAVANMEPSTRPRTRFLAFSALDRLNSSIGTDDWRAQAVGLMKDLDSLLGEEKFLWYDEANRYNELCNQLFDGDHQLGAWLEPTGLSLLDIVR